MDAIRPSNERAPAHRLFERLRYAPSRERLVEGVDVWINTPCRPWEASGTSGMKVLVNGGLNVSVLDGWWAEAYRADVGWAIGDGAEHGDDPAWDRLDAEALYTVLEEKIVPEFYSRDREGIPRDWVRRVRESMALLAPAFSANRTVRQYTEEHYIPAAAAYVTRMANHGVAGMDLVAWQKRIDESWSEVRFGPLNVKSVDGDLEFRVDVYLAGLNSADVRVELYAEPWSAGAAICEEMREQGQNPANSAAYVYSTRTPATRPAGDFTPRVIASHPLAMGLERNRILWQK
jgi:glycogen phosphorylase